MTPTQSAAHARGEAIILAEVGITQPLERQLAQDFLSTRGLIPCTRLERARIADMALRYLKQQIAWLTCWQQRGDNNRLPGIEARKIRAHQQLRDCITEVRAARAARAIQEARKCLAEANPSMCDRALEGARKVVADRTWQTAHE